MGTDFLRKKAKAFHKGLDRSRIELTRAHLFSRGADDLKVTMVARSIGDCTLNQGDDVLIRSEKKQLFIECGEVCHAIVVKPSDAWIEEIETHGGYANGIIAKTFPTLNILEVAFR